MRGIKAGLLAGIISGLIFGVILALLNATVFYGLIVNLVDQTLSQIPEEILELGISPPNREFAITIIVYKNLLMLPLDLISGLIIGLIFALSFSCIPGKNVVGKGIVIGIIFWILGSIPNFLGATQAYLESTYFILETISGLARWLFFGFLLGKFWIKFEK